MDNQPINYTLALETGAYIISFQPNQESVKEEPNVEDTEERTS